MAIKKILHVEDAYLIRESVREELEARGFDVTGAASINAAKDLLSTHEFDGIICDGNVNEPGDGVALAFALQAAGKNVAVFSFDTQGIPASMPSVRKDETDGIDQLIQKLHLSQEKQ